MFQGFKNDHASAKYGPLQKITSATLQNAGLGGE